MSKLICLAYLCFFGLSMKAQTLDSLTKKKQFLLGVHFQYHPYDFFLVPSFSLQKNQFKNEIRFGIGINRTFFQQRFYPQLTYQFSYTFIEQKQFSMYAFARASFYRLNFQFVNSNKATKWLDGLFGFGLLYGKRNQIGCSVGVGPSWELNYNTTLKRNQSIQTWNLVYEVSYYHTIRD